MNLVPHFIRKAWRHLGLKLGFIKPVVYKPDVLLEDVINRIVCSSTATGAFIVAVETKQAMIKILSYMEKNYITAIGATDLDLGSLPQKGMPDVLRILRSDPEHYQVVVVTKGRAAVGWSVPPEYKEYWGHVFMLSTFEQRDPWKTQFNGRLRRAL